MIISNNKDNKDDDDKDVKVKIESQRQGGRWKSSLHLLHRDKQFNNEEDDNEDDDDKDGDDKDDDNEDDDDKDVKIKIDQSSATCSIASTFQSLMRTIVLP